MRENMSNVVLLLGVILLSLVYVLNHVQHFVIELLLFFAFCLSIFSWVKLDSNTNSQKKELELERMRLENKKLEMEIRLLRKEVSAG